MWNIIGAIVMDEISPEFESLLKGYDLFSLLEELERIESRLGTTAEAPNDMQYANFIVHRLNNIQTEILLAEKLRSNEAEGSA